jgi:putative metallohydrolase (TIGR04338 family)
MVYRAETPQPSSPLPGLDACAAYMDRVVGTLWWQARFPDHTLDRVPRLRPGNGARQAFLRDEDDGTHTITLPRRYRTKGVVLHELAHWALRDQPGLPDHGRTFTRVLLDATGEYLGSDRAAGLEASYKEQRVRIGRPPRLGPDGRLRYGWDELLRLGRGRTLTLRHDPADREISVTGVMSGFERSGATVVMVDATGPVRVATKTVWHVEPAPAGPRT